MNLRTLISWSPWIALGALGAGVLAMAWKPPDSWSPSTPPLPGPDPFDGKPVDAYAPLQPEDECDPVAKPGVLLFRQWVIDKWGERPKSPQNIVRDCGIGGASGHKQGRAWDQMVSNQAQGDAVVDALLATDAQGNAHALARRAGLRYIIWAGKMWRSYPHAGNPSGSWEPYSGGESGSMHYDHVHYSFSKDGADGLTSLYDALRANLPVA